MRSTRRFSRLAAAGLAAALLLAACGGDSDDKPYSELLFVSDRYTLRSVDTAGNKLKDLASATIPGLPGTYARAGNVVTVTMPFHNLFDGFQADLVFSAGTGGTATSGVYPVTVVDGNTFTVTDTATGTITGGTLLRKPVTTRTGTYVQAGTTVTITLAAHGFGSNDDVLLDYTSGNAVDGAFQLGEVLDANTFTIVAAAAADTTGNVTISVGANYAIFGMAMHPSGKWMYTTSTYECWSGDPLCWGGALISRFAIDWKKGKLTFEKSAVSPHDDGAPVGITFNAAGTLMFNQDDELDGVDMWSVDPATGDLTYLASTPGGAASLHGLVVSTDGTRVYNGATTYTFDATSATKSITVAHADAGANSCAIVGTTLYAALQSSGWQLKTYSLANPDLPVEVGTISTNAVNQARELVVTADGKLVVASGFAGLKSYTYTGGAFAAATGAGETEYIDGFDAWPTGNVVKKMFRSLTLNGAGSLLASAYFTNDPNNRAFGGVPPAGVMLFTLAPDGSLAKVADWGLGAYSRAARFYQRP